MTALRRVSLSYLRIVNKAMLRVLNVPLIIEVDDKPAAILMPYFYPSAVAIQAQDSHTRRLEDVAKAARVVSVDWSDRHVVMVDHFFELDAKLAALDEAEVK